MLNTSGALTRCIVSVTATAALAVLAAHPWPIWAQTASGPSANAPTFQVGDTWTWTTGRTATIVAIEGSEHVTAGADGRRRYYDSNWTLVKVVDGQANPVSDAGIGRKRLDFPLSIGKEWSWSGKLLSVANEYRDYKDTFHVIGYEEVKTKAGVLKAFVINHEQEGRGRIGGPRTYRRQLWYSPEAKVLVKVEHTTSGWGQLQDYELQSYSLK